MNELPEHEEPGEFDPNEKTRKNQRTIYLAGAAVLALVGGWYLWTQLGATPAKKVDDTKAHITATAKLANSGESADVVNGDMQRQLDQAHARVAELEGANAQLAQAKELETQAHAADRQNAEHTISALEEEMNRTRGGAGAGRPASSSGETPAVAPFARPPSGSATAPPLTRVPASSAARVSGESSPETTEERPRRMMTVIRASTSARPAGDNAHEAGPGGQLTEVANRDSSVAPGAGAAPGSSKSGYFTSKLETFSTNDYVPPNAYATAKVLVGVDAATSTKVSADPKPVLLRVVGDAVSVGSDGRYQHTSLRGCMVNGAAYGELSSEKVYVKLQRITCPAGDKRFAVATVEGYVSKGGKAGVRGTVVERTGGLTARAAIAGTLQGLGTTLSQNFQRSSQGYNTTTGPGGVLEAQKLSPTEIAQGAVSGGVSNAASMLADYYIQRAEQYQPVIEMPTGVEVEIVFLSGFQVRGGS